MFRSRFHDRSHIKNEGIDRKDQRHRRQQVTTQLRKSKRDDVLRKKRTDPTFSSDDSKNNGGAFGSGPSSSESFAFPDDPDKVMLMVQAMTAPGADTRLKRATMEQFRVWERNVSPERSDQWSKTVDTSRMVPAMFSVLHGSLEGEQTKEKYELLLSAMHCLVDMSGSPGKFLTGLIAASMDLDKQKNLMCDVRHPKIQEMCVMIMGNIAAVSQGNRDHLIKNGFLGGIQRLWENIPATFDGQDQATKDGLLSLRRETLWFLSNLFRKTRRSTLGTRQDAVKRFEHLSTTLPLLRQALNTDDTDMASHALWSLTYCTNVPTEHNSHIGHILNVPGLGEAIVRSLTSSSQAVLAPAVETVGNICSGDDTHTRRLVVDMNVCALLLPLMTHRKATIRKNAMFAIENIAGCPNVVSDILIATPLMVSTLIGVLGNDQSEVQVAALFALANISLAKGGIYALTGIRGDAGVMSDSAPTTKFFANITRCVESMRDSPEALFKAMELVKTVLEETDDVSQTRFRLEEAGFKDELESLQQHPNPLMAEMADGIFDTFFEDSLQHQYEADQDSIWTTNNASSSSSSSGFGLFPSVNVSNSNPFTFNNNNNNINNGGSDGMNVPVPQMGTNWDKNSMMTATSTDTSDMNE